MKKYFLIIFTFAASLSFAANDKMEKAVRKSQEVKFHNFVAKYNKAKAKDQLEFKVSEFLKGDLMKGSTSVAKMEFTIDGEASLNGYKLDIRNYKSDEEVNSYIQRVIDHQKRNKKTSAIITLLQSQAFASAADDELEANVKLKLAVARLSSDWYKEATGTLYNSNSAYGLTRKEFVSLETLLRDSNVVSAQINCIDDNTDLVGDGSDHGNGVRDNSVHGRTIVIDQLNDKRVEVRVQPVVAYGKINYVASVKSYGHSSCDLYNGSYKDDCQKDQGEELYSGAGSSKLPASVSNKQINQASDPNEKLALALISCCEEVKEKRAKSCLQKGKDAIDGRGYTPGYPAQLNDRTGVR